MTEKDQIRTEQLAEAFLGVARVNHYMVGIVEPFTDEELLGAHQILVNKKHTLLNEEVPNDDAEREEEALDEKDVFDLAFACIETEKTKRRI